MALGVVDAMLLAAAIGLAVTRNGDGGGAGTGGPLVLPAVPGGHVAQPGAADPAELLGSGTTGIAGRRSASRGEVADRPWPARVAAPGPWAATLAGRGDRVAFATTGTIPGGLARTSFDLGSSDPRPSAARKEQRSSIPALLLPDGARWFPLGPVRLEGPGDVPFTTATAEGKKVLAVVPSLEALLSGGGATGVGTFVQPSGRQVDRLALPAGTRGVTEACPDRAAASPPPCQDLAPNLLTVQVTVGLGATIQASGDGEVSVAGRARAGGLGKTWEGLVTAVEAQQLRASASYVDDVWTVGAEGGAARQIWVDVWPVVDTRLSATSVRDERRGFLDVLRGDTYPLRITWTNTGFATSQIFEAEGVGPGAGGVGFDLNKTIGHDAGLGVTRGDRVVNLRGGGDIDSNLAPGERVDRGLSAPPGTSAAIILRGNFPDVRVALAVQTA